MRRLVAAAESDAIGYSGVSAVARATGVSRRAITEGLKELRQQKVSREARPALSRIRRKGGRTKKNRRQGSDSAGRSGSAGGSCDSWRSGITAALDLQERAEVGRGTPARGSRRQLSDGGRTAPRDGFKFAGQPENPGGETAGGSRPAGSNISTARRSAI